MLRVRACWMVAAVVMVLGGCSKQVEQREAIVISLRVSDRFPPNLVTASEWTISSIPNQNPLPLRAGATTNGTMGGLPYTGIVSDFDADGRQEYRISILGGLFLAARVFEGSLFAGK